ncbi:ABC transporter ATP-binding protein [Candidatus Thiodictyon syntrophicum]|jgi:putative ABC transport system ATP-binding protein|uniref:ABC transporter ATP-binding protein n=1 Tax=Candidatus Thiodictyon syntrophicum TaxID=1166950 RepID=A0A2K8U9Z9_9GAMM|nr:ABC transporter ATP-binding protein [Candidatus Thiodictyon syntrophicum]AUB82357.1 ABC transporter ATP-binding protein [Candidatus Thiodictyon syntrophicum]
MSSPALETRGLSMVYGTGDTAVRALDGVDFQVAAGQVMALMGPSGSGKTTLLMILGCLLHPTAGSVRVEGQALAGLSTQALTRLRLRRMGFIFQSYNLFPALTAAENVQVALELKGRDLGEASALLDLVGLAGRRRNFPAQLSGGEKQRVAIARALAGDPPILLADEPTAALDSVNGRAVVRLLGDLAHAQGRAVVIVTHDPRIGELADRVVHIEDGRIQG